jgi:hypothetical protein
LLGGAQRWRLADLDPRLLAAAIATTHTWAEERGARVRRNGYTLTIEGPLACDVQCEPVDLAELPAVELPAGGLVTAAALLDLVSQAWLGELARRCSAARAAVCFALSYDGRTTASPAEPEDAEVLRLFNRHQLGDKGFGAALGPGAASAAERSFAACGYEVRTAQSDWLIGPDAQEMQHALLDGWFAAASEIAPERRDALTAWHERRSAHVTAGRSTLVVGHVDLVGWPKT